MKNKIIIIILLLGILSIIGMFTGWTWIALDLILPKKQYLITTTQQEQQPQQEEIQQNEEIEKFDRLKTVKKQIKYAKKLITAKDGYDNNKSIQIYVKNILTDLCIDDDDYQCKSLFQEADSLTNDLKQNYGITIRRIDLLILIKGLDWNQELKKQLSSEDRIKIISSLYKLARTKTEKNEEAESILYGIFLEMKKEEIINDFIEKAIIYIDKETQSTQ